MAASHRRTAGFTMIEMLVVIAIISILSAMILVGATQLGIGSKKRKTETILAVLRQGIELAAANKGSTVSPVEHPLAGSRPGRSAFAGQRGRNLNGTGGSWVAALDATNEALTGVDEWLIGNAADQKRVLMPDDVFADGDVPMLFGLRRDLIGILGAEMEAVTLRRQISAPKSQATLLPGPYDASNPRYSDALCLVKPTGTAAENKRALDYLFGAGNIISELARLQAVFMPPDDNPGSRLKPPANAALGGRVWSPDGADPADGKPFWERGRIRDGVINSGPNTGQPDWKLYRMRGMGIYDAWNHEVLFTYSRGGGIRLMSAGNDGVMRWDPAGDRTLSTAADATGPAGDDRDGERDNIRQEVVQ